MNIKTIIKPSQFTEDECCNYLIESDKEGIDFWKTATEVLQGVLNDNLRDFGEIELPNANCNSVFSLIVLLFKLL